MSLELCADDGFDRAETFDLPAAAGAVDSPNGAENAAAVDGKGGAALTKGGFGEVGAVDKSIRINGAASGGWDWDRVLYFPALAGLAGEFGAFPII